MILLWICSSVQLFRIASHHYQDISLLLRSYFDQKPNINIVCGPLTNHAYFYLPEQNCSTVLPEVMQNLALTLIKDMSRLTCVWNWDLQEHKWAALAPFLQLNVIQTGSYLKSRSHSVPHRPPFNILQWPLVLISEALNAPTGSDPSGCHMTILLLLTGVTLLLQVTLVLRSGPSGALAQLHAVKGRRCEQERVSHLMDHTAAAL